jgi:uncharacterized protein YbjT (DUF2867 family)
MFGDADTAADADRAQLAAPDRLVELVASDPQDRRGLAGGEHLGQRGQRAGEGLAQAVDGVEAIVHLASAPYRRGYTRQVDVDGIRRLVAAAQRVGIEHLLYVSIVGVEAVPWGYFGIKLAAEQIIRDAGLGWTVLRATQFHPFADRVLTFLARLPVIPIDPGIQGQTVDPRDVAGRLVDAVHAGPAGQVLEFGGPEVFGPEQSTQQWLEATGRHKRLLRVRLPGQLGAAFRAGHLTTSQHPTGPITWRDYLAERTRVEDPARGRRSG